MVKTNKRTVSLVLGSGGARGLAHIGVIHWLEENNYEIRSIVGCSIGAVIGGIYAAGKLDVYEQWVRSITKVDIVTLLDLSWEKSGLVRGDKLINTLIKLVGEQLIEDHGLLANLYLSVLKAARALVNVQNCISRIHLCVDNTETAWDRAFPEQALTGAENNGKLPDT